MEQRCCCESDPHTPGRASGLNVLDSRAIGRASCYAQRFMRPGCYAYAVVPGYGQVLASDHPFIVDVQEEKSDGMSQHNVLVTNDGTGFSVDQPRLSINTGDLVLWSGNGRTSSPYSVVGEQAFFSSHRMVNECGYSHAFGTPGEYHWKDAFGSALSGVVRVSTPEASNSKVFAQWQKRLNQGNLVMIAEGRAEPSDIEILAGQTVFFAVITSTGISITDASLLNAGSNSGTSKRGAAS